MSLSIQTVHFLSLSLLFGSLGLAEFVDSGGFYRMTAILGYRSDGRCGYTHRLRAGAPSRCSVYGKTPCCNYIKEECGIGRDYCHCDKCTDFRTFNLAQKDDSIDLTHEEQRYIVSVLTEHLHLKNWTTIDHVQYSKKINSTRKNYVLIVRESRCPKTQSMNLEGCRLNYDAVNRLACFITMDQSWMSFQVTNKDCIRAKVYEKRPSKPQSQPLRIANSYNSSSLLRFVLIKLTQMDGGGRWFTSIGAPKITPHESYSDIFHVELKVTPSICHRSRSFIDNCSELNYAPVKTCAVDVQVGTRELYRLIHYNCDAICGSVSSNDELKRGVWTHWSNGICHQGILSRIRFCYHHLSREIAFDCKGTDIKLTEC